MKTDFRISKCIFHIRDRSPRDTKNNYSNYERKEKERKAEMEARAAALERARTLDRGIERGLDRGLDERRGGLEGGRSSSGLERRVNSHLNHASTASSQATGFGDWTEHRSSNGKNYYYNITTEVSQWEKPREWVEHEKAQARLANPARDSWGGGGTRAQGTDRGGAIPASRPQGTDRGSGAVARSQGTSERGMSDRGSSRGSNNQLSNCDTRTRGSQEKHGVEERPRSSPSLHQSSSRQRDRKMELRVSSATNSHDSGSSSVAGHLLNNHIEERSSLRENNRENREMMRDPRDGREGRETSREAGNTRDAKELRDMSAVLK